MNKRKGNSCSQLAEICLCRQKKSILSWQDNVITAKLQVNTWCLEGKTVNSGNGLKNCHRNWVKEWCHEGSQMTESEMNFDGHLCGSSG